MVPEMAPEMAPALKELITFTLSVTVPLWVQITDTPLTPEMTPALEALICSELHHPNILTTLRYACRPHKVPCIQCSTRLCYVMFVCCAVLCYAMLLCNLCYIRLCNLYSMSIVS